MAGVAVGGSVDHAAILGVEAQDYESRLTTQPLRQPLGCREEGAGYRVGLPHLGPGGGLRRGKRVRDSPTTVPEVDRRRPRASAHPRGRRRRRPDGWDATRQKPDKVLHVGRLLALVEMECVCAFRERKR